VLAALESVSLVTLFDEATPLELLKIVRPELYVKGGDYDVESLAETALVRRLGRRRARAALSSTATRRPRSWRASAAERALDRRAAVGVGGRRGGDRTVSRPVVGLRRRARRMPSRSRSRRAGKDDLALDPDAQRRAASGRALLEQVREQRFLAHVRLGRDGRDDARRRG
jgi:hypothetical protein